MLENLVKNCSRWWKKIFSSRRKNTSKLPVLSAIFRNVCEEMLEIQNSNLRIFLQIFDLVNAVLVYRDEGEQCNSIRKKRNLKKDT